MLRLPPGRRLSAAIWRRPGLAGVGRHHPAGYLLEAILNPNAIIVANPGYTAPDGHSIMPDYRHQLSLTEFIDLVAYLKSLRE